MTREEEIFADALDLPAAERAAFLDRACTDDPALRARVALLLEAHSASERFLEQSPSARLDPRPDEKPGDRIGRYTLIQKIGEGGCGVVYLAEQTEPVRRRVALKVIKLGMDTRQVISRFEAERQALALMDHADIARVYDAGTTDTGRPYFVMEFVDGVPITKFCDEQQLSLTARLELFARVCLALQHAHQKGIIHRDIKPSNILVARRDGVPTPKVIDFGIAKATQGRLTEATLFTGLDQLIGTPAYMSPEQAELRDLDIDTRSDVYSLGVLLYELLTGRPPFDPKSLVRAGVEEIRRIIRDVDPPRPSTVLATLGHADRASVAQHRRAAPARITSVLRGDLDWIVMRCLEKDRARRYDTAHELADDIRRHLRSEPVNARPPSPLYRTQRFAARHRFACAAIAAIAASLIAGTIVSVRQAIRATRAERAANLANADAQRRQEQAEALLTFMLGDFREELKKIGKLPLLDAVGDKAMAYFASLNPRDLSDPALANQAKALYQIGDVRMSEARYHDAEPAFHASYQRSVILNARHPKNADMLFDRGQAEFWIGFAARRRGDLSAARRWFTRYQETAVELSRVGGDPHRAQQELIFGYHAVAVMEYETGHYAAAEAAYQSEREMVEKALQASPDNTTYRGKLVDLLMWMGLTAEWSGSLEQALSRFNEATAAMKLLVDSQPSDTPSLLKLAVSHARSGSILALTGRKAEAQVEYDQGAGLFAKLLDHDPKNNQWRIEATLLKLDATELALAEGGEVVSRSVFAPIRAEIAAMGPTVASSQVVTRLVAKTWRLEGRLLLAQKEADAGPALSQAIELCEKSIRAGRADDWMVWEFCQASLLSAKLDAMQGRAEEARQHGERILEVLRQKTAGTSDWRIIAAEANALILLGRTSEAQIRERQLQRMGYRPIDPFAAATSAVASRTNP